MKYMGSKSRIARDIVPIIQKHIEKNGGRVYVEPFVGGANIIDKVKCDRKVGFDINLHLMRLFQHLQGGGALPEEITREEYTAVRENPTVFHDWYVGCVGFLSSYNGKYFGGYAGKVHTKAGITRDYYDEARRNVVAQIEHLRDVEFNCMDYRKWRSESSFENCVIYCDPPYATTTKYSGIPAFDHSEFWEIMRNWSERNTVLISEQTAPADFECIWMRDVTRTNDNSSRFVTTEKLFRYAG